MTVRVQPVSGETILFFSIDDHSNPPCKFRQLLGMQGENICDLLVYYATQQERTVCFVELKGKNRGKAVA